MFRISLKDFKRLVRLRYKWRKTARKITIHKRQQNGVKAELTPARTGVVGNRRLYVMRRAVLGILSASALALVSTAANATVAVITCDPTIDNGCSAANPASPAPATISWSD